MATFLLCLSFVLLRNDYIVMGEGEETIIELMAVGSKEENKLKNIQGLGYKFENEIVINSRRQRRTDLDKIALPGAALR